MIAVTAIRPLVVAQPNLAENWQTAIQAARLAEDETTRLRQLRDALTAAEAFGESDSRLLETLVAFAAPCVAGECDPQQRIHHLERALRVQELARPADGHLADLLMTLGALASVEGRHRDALHCYRNALQIRQKASVGDGGLAKAYAAVAKAYHQMNDRAQARLTMDHALESLQRAGETASEELGDLLEESGNLYSDEDAGTKAQGEYDKALAVRRRIWGATDWRYVESMRGIAAHMTWQLPAYAELLFKRIVQASRGAEGESSEEYYGAVKGLAAFYEQHKRLDEAGRLYGDAFRVRSSFGRAGDAEGARCLLAMARIRMGKGQHEGAIEVAEHSLAIRNTLAADPRHETPAIQALLAEAHLEKGDTHVAERYYRELASSARGKDPALMIQTLSRLSRVYERRGDYTRAVEKAEAAVAALESLRPGDDPELADTLTRLSGLYSRLARPVEAWRANLRANQIHWLNLLRSQTRPGVINFVLLAMVAAAVSLAGAAVAGYAWLENNLDSRIASLHQDGPARRLEFHGEGGPLFALRARSLLLSVLTAGLYGFWARAGVKRYLCAQAEFDSDRLVYHGTGREMFLGWMKGLLVAAVIAALPWALPSAWEGSWARTAGRALALAAAAALWPVARAGAHRYRMSRTSWRGVRFGFRGSTTEFQLLSLRGLLLTVASCGLLYPELQVRVRRFLYNQTYFGDRAFRFTGRGSDLVPQFALALPLTLLTFGIFWAWWSALRHRYFWAHTLYGGARFRCTVTGQDLLSLWAGNALVLAATFGFGLSWVTVRSARFWSRHVELTGDPELATVRQDAQTAVAATEDTGGFVGFDFGFLH